MNVEKNINELYGGRLRVRVCGLLVRDDRLLLIRHKSKNGTQWLPPGGGLEYGETIEEALRREIKEEVNMNIFSSSFFTMTEFLDLPLHAIEIFYRIHSSTKTPILGYDPESKPDEQLIQEVSWLSHQEITDLPTQQKHSILSEKYLNLIFK